MGNFLKASLIILPTLSLLTPVQAEIPQSPEFRDYAHILKRSPFIIKVNKTVAPIVKPKKKVDYFLRGVTKLNDRWMVIVFNKTKPDQNIILKQGGSDKAGIQLIEVIQDKQNYKNTIANLKIDSETVSVGYRLDELLKKAAPKKKSLPTTTPRLKAASTSNTSGSGLLPPLSEDQQPAEVKSTNLEQKKRTRPRIRTLRPSPN